MGLVGVDGFLVAEAELHAGGFLPLRPEAAHVGKLRGEITAVGDEQTERPAGLDATRSRHRFVLVDRACFQGKRARSEGP
jgi:hypothetical protein